MKKIEAFIKPFKLDAVGEALVQQGIKGMTVTEVYGCGRQGGRSAYYRGVEYVIEYLPKMKLEVSVADELVPQVVETIAAAAWTGRIGDGKICVLSVGEAEPVRGSEPGVRTVPRAA